MFKILFLTLLHFNIYAEYKERNNIYIDYVIADSIKISDIDTKIRDNKFIITLDDSIIMIYDIYLVDDGVIFATFGDKEVLIYGNSKQIYIEYNDGYITFIRDKTYKLNNYNNIIK
jgi:hypothetical protein